MDKTLPKHKLDARLTRKTMCKRELTSVHRLRKILSLPASSIATAANRNRMDSIAKNLEALQKHHWLSDRRNVILVDLTTPTWV